VTDPTDDTAARVALQRHVTAVVLKEIGPVGFALAGSGAIREHGFTDRPTNEVDLFATATTSAEEFAAAVATAEQVLSALGYQVTRTRTSTQFARLLIETSDERVMELDLAIDWRGEPPAGLAIGPVLALNDAVASEVAAVYSRAEVRDYLDLEAIRRSARFTDAQLIALTKGHDPGFDLSMFIGRLRDAGSLDIVEAAEYEMDAATLEQVKNSLALWADQLTQSGSHPDAGPQLDLPSRGRGPGSTAPTIGL
jgi:hypothetical protein